MASFGRVLGIPVQWWRHGFAVAVIGALVYSNRLIVPHLSLPTAGIHQLFCLAFVPWVILRRRELATALHAGWPLSLLILLCLARGYGDWGNMAIFTAQCLVGLVIAVEFSYRERHDILLTLAVSIVLLQWLAIIFYPQLSIYSPWRYAGAWRGMNLHKNGMGVYVGLAGIYLLWRLLLQPPLRTRVFLSVMSVLWCILLWKSHSMTAQLATLAGAACLLVFVRGVSRRTLLWLAVACAFAGALLGLLLATHDVWRTYMPAWMGKDITLTGRTRLWQLVWPYIAREPWGYGFNFWFNREGLEVAEAFRFRVHHAHNGWLEALLQAGIAGGVLFTLSIVAGVYYALKLLASEAGKLPRQEALWGIGFLGFFCVENIAESMALGIVQRPLMPWFVMVVYGLSYSYVRYKDGLSRQ